MTIHNDKIWPFLAGFILTANLYLLPFLASSPRATDLAGLLLGCWVLVRLVHGRQKSQPLVIVGVVSLIPVIWMFFSLLGNDSVTAVLTARWLLAMPWALALIFLMENDKRQEMFAWGILVGCLLNVLVILMQKFGLQSMLQMVGLSSSGANYRKFVSHQVRIPGLHGHHNASSSVTSLLVPVGFYLYYRHKLKLNYLLFSLFGLLIAIHLTSTRSPIVVAVFTVIFVSALARKFRQSILIGVVLLSILVPMVIVYGPPGGWARWNNTEALISNASERAASGLGAVELCVENPLGMGVIAGRIELAGKTGIRATHNAFLQAALVWGLPFGMLVSVGLLLAVFRGFGGINSSFFLPSLLAFHVVGLFLFEEHLNNPTFIILAAWLIALAFVSKLRTEKFPSG